MTQTKCPNGSLKDKKTGKCVLKANIVKRPKCPNGSLKDKKTGKCVLKANIVKRPKCPNGSLKDKKTGKCVSKAIVQKPLSKSKDKKKPHKKSKSVVKPMKLKVNPKLQPMKLKVNPKLQPLFNVLLGKKDLHKVGHMKTIDIRHSAKNLIGKDLCYVSDGNALSMWLSRKYRDVVNEDMRNVSLHMLWVPKKEAKVDIPRMKECVVKYSDDCKIVGLLNYAHYATQAKKDKKRLYLTLIHLRYNDGVGHANLLVHNLKTNKLHRFEPHGHITIASGINVDKYLKKMINASYTRGKYKKEKRPIYLDTKTMIPLIGPQNLDKNWGGMGRCIMWTLAYMQHRIEYPHLSEEQIHKFLGETPESATKFIQKYQTYIRSQIKVIEVYRKKAEKLAQSDNKMYLNYLPVSLVD